MARLGKIASVFVIANALLPAPAVRADDQDVIDYRQHIMKTMGEQVAAIGMISEHRAPVYGLAVHAQVLAITAATAKKAFESKTPGGNAKPDIWERWPDFAKRLDVLVAATNELATIAKDDGFPAAETKVKAVSLVCKSCHDAYGVQLK